MKQAQITWWCQQVFQSQVPPGGTYIDATMGNGYDTCFLCQLAGTRGHVWAFDIQETALHKTRELLKTHGFQDRATLILDGHEHMGNYLKENSADGIFFNFGYLPGGDHRLGTRTQTSLAAVKAGLKILKKGGMMSLCIYSGKDTGYEEREALLDYLKELSGREYTVIANTYLNRRKDPPLPVFLFK